MNSLFVKLRARSAATLLGILAINVVHAAPKEADLGDGLLYARVHAAATDLPTGDLVRGHSCVIDLRFAQGDPVAADVLGNWITSHAAPRTPLFILVNGATSGALVRTITEHHVPGIMTVGIEGQSLAPDIMVKQTSDDERRAYDAYDAGTTIALLTTDNPNKQRNDEASLSHDHASETAEREDPADSTPAPKAKSAPIDAVLQRAIQLHRALRAMKRV